VTGPATGSSGEIFDFMSAPLGDGLGQQLRGGQHGGSRRLTVTIIGGHRRQLPSTKGARLVREN
jgi:hypothetical protein